MPWMEILIAVALGSALLLGLAWVAEYGFVRGLAALAARAIWLTPFILAFFPRTRTETLPRTMTLKTIHVLLDDSASMSGTEKGSAPLAGAQKNLGELQDECTRLGCVLKVTRLSELSREVANGFTPLGPTVLPWLYGTGGDPWMLVSDGGDFRPAEPWDEKLSGFGRQGTKEPRGLILGFKPKTYSNIWIETPSAPLFSFQDKPLEINATLKREKPELRQETIQVQVLSEDQAVATLNATFAPDETAVDIRAMIPPLARGQHLLTVKALPTADESAIWDNTTYKTVEVMPNTVGLLHLLGAPSWDGRFMRRYLKSEPKYDLISFFILRDPGDMQLVNERELSLIPFPVDRLFNEELPNFRAVTIQNFALYQFLEPGYQENLVKFVQNGGSLLFIGGPRALQNGDMIGAPLASILPFELDGLTNNRPFGGDKSGPYYDKDLGFQIEMARPSPTERALANVFDDWERLGPQLASQKNLRGLHHMENVTFKQGAFTPLLEARLESGAKVPLAVASYPGKGRALWVFSDALWQTALNLPENSSREVYNEFVKNAMTWLLRQELRKSLVLKNLHLSTGRGEGTQWQVSMVGPAARYFRTDESWNLEVCQTAVQAGDVVVDQTGPENWTLSGTIPRRLAGGTRCSARITGRHPAFGSVESSVATIVPDLYHDREISAAPHKLVELSERTGAKLVFSDGNEGPALKEWLGGMTGAQGVALPARYKTVADHFWVLELWWFWLCLALLPLEVLIRRWPELTGAPRP